MKIFYIKEMMIINGKDQKDEWQAISLSYTSGTTGKPKGLFIITEDHI